MKRIQHGFQTPPETADLMLSLVDDLVPKTILEPCSGIGNLVIACQKKFPKAEIISVEHDAEYCEVQRHKKIEVLQKDFFTLSALCFNLQHVDLIVANPPHSPMLVGYDMMNAFMRWSEHFVVIMPWLWLINSQKRYAFWKPHIRQIRHLPRSTFPGARIQTAIFDIDLSKKYNLTELI